MLSDFLFLQEQINLVNCKKKSLIENDYYYIMSEFIYLLK